VKDDPEQLIAGFLSEYRASGNYSRDYIARLAELATSEDPTTTESATRAFFGSLVERLADSFEPDAVSLYNRAFSQVIDVCRRDPRATQLDRELREYGLRGEEDLVERATGLRQIAPLSDKIERDKVRRIIVLSRVTLGADVAIASVIIERMKLEFPAAEIVLVGGSKGSELFGGDSRLSFRQLVYRRGGTTAERLLTWIDLLRCVRDLTDGLTAGEYLVVDPDSRLTQLGLLPVGNGRESDRVAQQTDYMFFPSREYGSGTSRSLSELTSLWLDELFCESFPTLPRVSLRETDIKAARDLIDRIEPGSRPVIAINFGVGENELKRVGNKFEAMLVTSLVMDGALIILDKGAGDAEVARANAVIAEVTRIEKGGRRVRAIDFDEEKLIEAPNTHRLDGEILVWNGRIGVLSGLIGQSDLYIGYDSAGQHIASALGVKCIDVFAGYSSPRMLERWRPTGSAETRTIAVDTNRGAVYENELVAEVHGHASEMLRTSRK